MEKLGRNSACPCGSGKKMKKCCNSLSVKKKYAYTKGFLEEGDQSSKLTHLVQSTLSTSCMNNMDLIKEGF